MLRAHTSRRCWGRTPTASTRTTCISISPATARCARRGFASKRRGMIAAQPSRTAFAAAMYRAAHQELDEGQLFADPFAMRILGGTAARQQLGEELAAAGFDAGGPARFVWLGVVPYLTDTAVFGTLRYIAGSSHSETVFDYANPLEQLDAEYRASAAARAKRAAEIGEPFLSSFDTAELHTRLWVLGASEVDDLGPQRLAARYGRPAPVGDRGGHIVWVRF